MQTSQLFTFSILSSKKQAFFTFVDHLLDKTPKQGQLKTFKILTPNPEQIVLAQHDASFAQLLRQADILLPDGIGLVWASTILCFFGKKTQRISERITGVEVVEHILAINRGQGKLAPKVLIIGGRDYRSSFQSTLKKTDQTSFNGETFEDEQSLIMLAPNLYWTEAYQEKAEILPIEEVALARVIKKVHPDVVFVALGAPDQEKWIIQHQQLLENSQVKLVMAVGGSFDFIFAKVSRAPLIWQKLGLEWLWRLIQQPWRKKRQLRLIEFIYLVFRELWRKN